MSVQLQNNSVENKNEITENSHSSYSIIELPNDIFSYTFRVIGNTFNYLTSIGEAFSFENVSSLSYIEVFKYKELFNLRKTVAKSFVSLMLTCSRLYKIATSEGSLISFLNLCKKNIAVAKTSVNNLPVVTHTRKRKPQCCFIQ